MQAHLLKKYVGSYNLSNGNVIGTKVENNQLVLYFSPANKYVLHAASEAIFYSAAEFLNVSFQQDPHKNINALQIERFGGTKTANKIVCSNHRTIHKISYFLPAFFFIGFRSFGQGESPATLIVFDCGYFEKRGL